MMKNMRERGITVIALVITIIIMLILAGITIGNISNNFGLIGKAKSAVDEYKNKQKEEEDSLKNLLNTIDEFSGEDSANGSYKIGDEVRIDNDEFYVIENSDSSKDTVTLLAKYNLNRAGTAQVPNANDSDTSCPFASENYWDSAFQELYGDVHDGKVHYLDINNVAGEKPGDAIYKAKQYALSKGALNGRLLTIEEVNNLKSNYKNIIWGRDNYQPEICQLSYWVASTSGNTSTYGSTNKICGVDFFVYYSDNYLDDELPHMVYDSNEANGSGECSFGVRPVITISKNEISQIYYNSNGGTGTIPNNSGVQLTIADGSTLTPPPTRTFGGWNTHADGTGIDYNVGQKVSKNLNLYAKWYYTPESNLSIGQEVTVGRERFYVLENSNSTQNTVTLLSKYNLHKNGNVQVPNADLKDTTDNFSSTNYWENKWNLQKLDLNNENGESPGDAIYKARQYASSKGGSNGRLLTFTEFSNLEYDYENMIYGKSNYWYYISDNANFHNGLGLSYWLSTVSDFSDTAIHIVYGLFLTHDTTHSDVCDYDSMDIGCGLDLLGVRPVITVPKNLVY